VEETAGDELDRPGRVPGVGETDRRFEWVILVLGLAGVVAIFVPFTAGLSPLAALPVLRVLGSSVPALDVFTRIASTTATLAFFLAPLLSCAQLSRCLRRPIARWRAVIGGRGS
jgi:hypothetical protein